MIMYNKIQYDVVIRSRRIYAVGGKVVYRGRWREFCCDCAFSCSFCCYCCCCRFSASTISFSPLLFTFTTILYFSIALSHFLISSFLSFLSFLLLSSHLRFSLPPHYLFTTTDVTGEIVL